MERSKTRRSRCHSNNPSGSSNSLLETTDSLFRGFSRRRPLASRKRGSTAVVKEIVLAGRPFGPPTISLTTTLLSSNQIPHLRFFFLFLRPSAGFSRSKKKRSEDGIWFTAVGSLLVNDGDGLRAFPYDRHRPEVEPTTGC